MNAKEKIDYMIQCLELAKNEIAYAEDYEQAVCYGLPTNKFERIPNGTIIRENLKMVGRIANITAKEVTLSVYCSQIFKE